jgi:hypothetical protein
MKKVIFIFVWMTALTAGHAQDSRAWLKRWVKGELVLLNAGYQIPLYGSAGKRFTDPLLGYSREGFVFVPMISSEIKNGFGFDLRMSYLQSDQWLEEMERNFQTTDPGAYVSVYYTGKSNTMRLWSLMAGPSYRIKKGKGLWMFNLLGGFGNQPVKSLAADVKIPGSHALTTWQIEDLTDDESPAVWFYKNIFMLGAGARYVFQFPSGLGVFGSCDVICGERSAFYLVTRTEQITGAGSEYTVDFSKPGISITPGLGVLYGF